MADANTERKCAVCGKPQGEKIRALKRCAKCTKIWYCSVNCQKSDWATHRKQCIKPPAMNDLKPATEKYGSSSGEDPNSAIHLRSCRKCSPHFSYVLPNAKSVTILVGVPNPSIKYKAISHVWGNPVPITMVCDQCRATHTINLKSRATFYHIIALAGPDSMIWLDNMSINQGDPEDVASQVSVMGDIYSHAECVSVLLPMSDGEAFKLLESVTDTAGKLLDRKWQFEYSQERSYDIQLPDGSWKRNTPDNELKDTSILAQKYFEEIRKLEEALPRFTYWKRAWTFQEWSLAHDIEIARDDTSVAISSPPNISKLEHVKSQIVYVAIMMCDYKLRRHQHANIDVGFSRGFAATKLNSVKRLFPLEDVFLSFEEVNRSELVFQIGMPNEGTNEILGLRPVPRSVRDPEMQFRARLSVMLNSFADIRNQREARFQADLVCCWAAMCNLSYNYLKGDTLGCAMIKVIRELRQRGLTVYNFQSSDNANAEIDFSFFRYAHAHPQTNATNRAEFLGQPIFTGRADTATHFMYGLAPLETSSPKVIPEKCGPVSVRRLQDAYVIAITDLRDEAGVLDAFNMVTSGNSDDMLFYQIGRSVLSVLRDIPEPLRNERKLVTTAIRTTRGRRLFAWTLCPSGASVSALFVGREEMNGTLVLAMLDSDCETIHIGTTARLGEVSDTFSAIIIGYLTISDHQSGTFLVQVDPQGSIDMSFETPIRGDILNSEYHNNRFLRCTLGLEDKVIPGSAKTYNDWESARAMTVQPNDDLIRQYDPPRQALADNLEKLLRRSPDDFSRRKEFIDIDVGQPLVEARAQESSKRLRLNISGMTAMAPF
jgi:Heterokaryon incompatibility protein (HET)/MYND finger